MAYAWTCPRCGDVVPGRKNPGARNLEIRSCIDCLFATEKLVTRVRGAELPHSRAAKLVAAPPGVWRGLDLQAESDRLANLEIIPAHVRENLPKVTLRKPRPENRLAGLALLRSAEIILFVRPTLPRAFVVATLVHEFAHVWAGPFVPPHGDQWRANFIELIREGYGEEPAFPKGESSNALDVSCEKAIARWLQRTAKLRRAPADKDGTCRS